MQLNYLQGNSDIKNSGLYLLKKRHLKVALYTGSWKFKKNMINVYQKAGVYKKSLLQRYKKGGEEYESHRIITVHDNFDSFFEFEHTVFRF